MADVNKHACDSDLLDRPSKRVVVGDGGVSSQLQAADPSLDAVETKYVQLQSG